MSGVEVVESDLSNNPCCIHGPTILFSRLVGDKRKNYFACSACRDRKDCNFFMWEDELHQTYNKTNIWQEEIDNFTKNLNQNNLYKTYRKVRKRPQGNRFYCRTCECLTLKPAEHETHLIINNISDYKLTHPSEFLSPLDKAKKEAQFLFTSTAVETIINMVKKLDIKRVLCVGTPRIHEYILSKEVDSLKSLLLDIDKRYLNFYDKDQFCMYNMFNNYFFLPDSKTVLQDFMQSEEKIMLITDPPFGGRIEPLAMTIKDLWNMYGSVNDAQNNFPVFFIFPYFMESQIRNYLPQFNMCDYRVDYDNHSLFQKGPQGRKQGSPVRIFTNIDLRLVELPKDQGYKYCLSCKIWVSNENNHCSKCNKCTSKDGRTYVHCNLCSKCVKPTWKHCNKCRRCTQPVHNCREIPFNQKCFHCKQEGHKKIDCPNVSKDRQKRKYESAEENVKKTKIEM